MVVWPVSTKLRKLTLCHLIQVVVRQLAAASPANTGLAAVETSCTSCATPLHGCLFGRRTAHVTQLVVLKGGRAADGSRDQGRGAWRPAAALRALPVW